MSSSEVPLEDRLTVDAVIKLLQRRIMIIRDYREECRLTHNAMSKECRLVDPKPMDQIRFYNGVIQGYELAIRVVNRIHRNDIEHK